ncbi:MAG: thiamine pyrophosphate-binding protein [Solirubrobacteraceae bacterium]
MPPISTAEAIVRRLEQHGCEVVFGIPGAHVLPVYRHLAASTIRHVVTRHEQGAGYAADGYARVSGRPGVCIVTSGPGVTNVASAVANARHDSIPLIVIAPGMPADVDGRDTGFLHEMQDQAGAMAAIAGASVRVQSAEQAADAITEAFESFATGRPRPVYLEIPLDNFGTTAEIEAPASRNGSPPQPDPADVDEVIGLLDRASRPVCVLGGSP